MEYIPDITNILLIFTNPSSVTRYNVCWASELECSRI